MGIADTGKNIWLNEDESRILRHYFGVSGTPHYWIIGENGDFVSESATDPSDPKTYEKFKTKVVVQDRVSVKGVE